MNDPVTEDFRVKCGRQKFSGSKEEHPFELFFFFFTCLSLNSKRFVNSKMSTIKISSQFILNIVYLYMVSEDNLTISFKIAINLYKCVFTAIRLPWRCKFYCMYIVQCTYMYTTEMHSPTSNHFALFFCALRFFSFCVYRISNVSVVSGTLANSI